ncbi:MAG TPA: WD40 repeat domain-containing protein [Allosphingosinicella sp.]
MKRLGLLAFILIAGCGSAPQPVAGGPRLRAEPAAGFRDDEGPGREAAFSPDGRLLATTSASGLVTLRRMPGLKVVHRFRHPGGAAAIVFSPDGKGLATAGYDGVVRLWETAGGRPGGALEEARGTVWSLDYSPDGSRLAAAGEDGVVRIWNSEGRVAARLQGHGRNVWEVRFSPDGRRLASGSFDATARLWDSATGKALATLREHEEAVVGLAWSGDGRWLATGGDDSTILIRRSTDGRPVRRLEAGNHVYKIAFSPDSRWLATAGRARGGLGTLWHGLTGAGGDGEAVRLWRVADGALIQALKMPEDVMYVGFSPDGRRLVASGDDGTVTLWTLRAGTE